MQLSTSFDRFGSNIKDGNLPDPDIYCSLEGKKINIEVAHLYGADPDEKSEESGVRMIFGR